jgi:hypothetical protein
MIALLAAAEDAVELASRATMQDCPAFLESAVEMMTEFSGHCVDLAADERKLILPRTLQLQARLALLKRSTERSYSVVAAYSHQSGVTSQEYSPRGLSQDVREPSLLLTQM